MTPNSDTANYFTYLFFNKYQMFFFYKGKNWILNFKLFSDFIRLKASYCIFSNFCAIFNVNYYVKKRFSFLKLFFYLKLMKDLQKK